MLFIWLTSNQPLSLALNIILLGRSALGPFCQFFCDYFFAHLFTAFLGTYKKGGTGAKMESKPDWHLTSWMQNKVSAGLSYGSPLPF